MNTNEKRILMAKHLNLFGFIFYNTNENKRKLPKPQLESKSTYYSTRLLKKSCPTQFATVKQDENIVVVCMYVYYLGENDNITSQKNFVISSFRVQNRASCFCETP